MKQIKSSNIDAIGHANGTLTIKFRNGGTYDFDNFPADLHEKFMAATDSHGRFFHEHIRNKFVGKRRDEK